MKVEIRKPFMQYAKGQVVETSEERAKAWINSRLAIPFVQPKEPSELLAKLVSPDEIIIPEKNVEGARALKKKIDEHYANKAKA